MIAYAADKRAVVDDLAAAMRDPASEVRNNAMRALALFAQYAREHPESNVSVPRCPFVDLLNSIDWSDPEQVSGGPAGADRGRDAALLKRPAHPGARVTDRDGPLEEPGHAYMPFFILGRVAGMSEDAINAAWERRRIQRAVIRAARQRRCQ